MSATTIWKDKTTNDLEQTIKSLVDEVKPDEKSSIVWGDWDIHKKFDKTKKSNSAVKLSNIIISAILTRNTILKSLKINLRFLNLVLSLFILMAKRFIIL